MSRVFGLLIQDVWECEICPNYEAGKTHEIGHLVFTSFSNFFQDNIFHVKIKKSKFANYAVTTNYNRHTIENHITNDSGFYWQSSTTHCHISAISHKKHHFFHFTKFVNIKIIKQSDNRRTGKTQKQAQLAGGYCSAFVCRFVIFVCGFCDFCAKECWFADADAFPSF